MKRQIVSLVVAVQVAWIKLTKRNSLLNLCSVGVLMETDDASFSDTVNASECGFHRPPGRLVDSLVLAYCDDRISSVQPLANFRLPHFPFLAEFGKNILQHRFRPNMPASAGKPFVLHPFDLRVEETQDRFLISLTKCGIHTLNDF